jgi:hypothetical protein
MRNEVGAAFTHLRAEILAAAESAGPDELRAQSKTIRWMMGRLGELDCKVCRWAEERDPGLQERLAAEEAECAYLRANKDQVRAAKFLEQRVLNRIKKVDGPLATQCWSVQAFQGSPNCYGVVTLFGHRYTTHRLMFARQYGPIPKGKFICHHCDYKPCCNPDHLFLGTPADNTADHIAKGRRGPWIDPEAMAALQRRTEFLDSIVRKLKVPIGRPVFRLRRLPQ